MKRRLRNSLTAMSLLVFVVLAVACVRSHLVWREYLGWAEADGLTWHRVILRLGRGQIGVAFDRVAHLPPVPPELVSEIRDDTGTFHTDGIEYGQVDPRSEMNYRLMTRQLTSFWRRQGFYFVFHRDHRPAYVPVKGGIRYHRQPKVETTLVADTPYWPLLLLTGAAPALHLLRARRRRRRARAGLCPGCGYDLTGNVSGTCPECGSRPLDGRIRTCAAPG